MIFLKRIIVLILFSILFSCNNLKKKTNSINNVEKDSIQIDKEFGSIFSVFKVSPKSFGIFIELEFNQKNELNKLYSKMGESLLNLAIDKKFDKSNLILMDSSGYQSLYSNPKITNSLSKYINKNFNLYCTKGITKSKIKDITFHLSDCQTNYVILRFHPISDTLGYPVFAMEKKIDLKYGKFEELKTKYNSVENKEDKDYPDNKHVTLFARKDNYYFGYRDDFKRYENKNDDYYENLKVYFPYRVVLKSNKTSLNKIFYNEMDLFGVPCD